MDGRIASSRRRLGRLIPEDAGYRARKGLKIFDLNAQLEAGNPAQAQYDNIWQTASAKFMAFPLRRVG
jgi:hypothetical protein